MEFDIEAKFKGWFNDISSELQKQRALQRAAYKANAPVLSRIPFSGVIPASGFLVLPTQGKMGPEQGRIWYVRSIGIGGTVPGTAVTGRADVFVSAASFQGYTALAQIGMGDWRDQTATIPNIAFYGRGELPLHMGEKLYIVVSGATNGQQIQGGVTIEEYEEAALSQEWGL